MGKNSKDEQLEQFRVDDRDQKMTTNQGLKVSEDEFSLKAGVRGPTLLRIFSFVKNDCFDHERILSECSCEAMPSWRI
jgi:catalase